MQLTDNTILITGGAAGIGRGLAEAFHRLGNRVIIADRRRDALDAVAAAHPGLHRHLLDLNDPAAITRFAGEVSEAYPTLNVLCNNAGILPLEDLRAAPAYLAAAEEVVATNLLGPIRLTAALLPHLLAQPRAVVMNVSSDLAFVPMTAAPTYSATKAALHSYSLSLRHQLEDTPVEVIEIIPTHVQTALMGPEQLTDERAMPLADYIAEVMAILTREPDAAEVVVERCRPFRFAAEHGQAGELFHALNVAHTLG